jgi:hypothetical protein
MKSMSIWLRFQIEKCRLFVLRKSECKGDFPALPGTLQGSDWGNARL